MSRACQERDDTERLELNLIKVNLLIKIRTWLPGAGLTLLWVSTSKSIPTPSSRERRVDTFQTELVPTNCHRDPPLSSVLDVSGEIAGELIHSVWLMTGMFGIFQCNRLITMIKSIDFSLILDYHCRGPTLTATMVLHLAEREAYQCPQLRWIWRIITLAGTTQHTSAFQHLES